MHKVPLPPPPWYFRGKDKITIHEDIGTVTVSSIVHKTFLEWGSQHRHRTGARPRRRVGAQTAYLLLYDDVPDGDPEVHLQGFGLKTRTPSSTPLLGPRRLALRGPGVDRHRPCHCPGLDNGKEPHHSMGQLIWRYHPETRRYESCEGGGNAFGVEIDAKGPFIQAMTATPRVPLRTGRGITRRASTSMGRFPTRILRLLPGHEAIECPGSLIRSSSTKPTRSANVSRLALRPRPVVEPRCDEPRSPRWIVVPARRWPGRLIARPLVPPRRHQARARMCCLHADWYDRQVNHYRNHEGQIDSGNGRIYRLRARDSGASPFTNRSTSLG